MRQQLLLASIRHLGALMQEKHELRYTPTTQDMQRARRVSMGNADRKPPVHRPGSDRAYELPSRVGSRLIYPDGRVEVVE